MEVDWVRWIVYCSAIIFRKIVDLLKTVLYIYKSRLIKKN